MADINCVNLIGHLTRDEELSYTPGGMAVGKFAVAINRKIKKGQEWIDESNFFDIVVWGKQAELLKQYLVKGKQVGITGFLKQERWTDTNGQNRSAVRIVANDVQLLGGGNSSEKRTTGTHQYPQESFNEDIVF